MQQQDLLQKVITERAEAMFSKEIEKLQRAVAGSNLFSLLGKAELAEKITAEAAAPEEMLLPAIPPVMLHIRSNNQSLSLPIEEIFNTDSPVVASIREAVMPYYTAIAEKQVQSAITEVCNRLHTSCSRNDDKEDYHNPKLLRGKS